MAETTIASEATTQGQDQSPPIDMTALSDIATNGALANQMMGEITKALDGLTSVVIPVSSGGTGRDTLTDHAVLVGNDTDPVTLVSPSATSGVALVSQGSSADPVFGAVSLTAGVTGTLPVANGGSGRSTLTAYAVLCGGTTTTGAMQSIASVGTAGQVLTSNGAGALPTFQATTKTIAVGASFTFKAPSNETVALILNSAFAWTITQTNTITEAGTATVAVKIGSTTLGGGANAASTSLNTASHASSNSVAISNQINVTFTSVSSTCENLCLTIWGTRTI